MNQAIVHQFKTIRRSLRGATLWKLRRAVPQFRARAQGVSNPDFLYRLALAAVKPVAAKAGPAEQDAMAFYLIAVAGIAEAESQADPDPGDKIDSLSEMDELESLRLQMAMDRMSKLMSTLSNLLKKQSDTAAAITQNLK